MNLGKMMAQMDADDLRLRLLAIHDSRYNTRLGKALVKIAKTITPTKKNTIVYLDHTKNGDDYTVYVGKHCVGTFLFGDIELAKYIEIIDGEKNIREGLDNR